MFGTDCARRYAASMRGRQRTSTSNFGAGRRENHDATALLTNASDRPEICARRCGTTGPRAIAEPFIRGDARHMDAIEDGSVALVVTSPPYFAGKQYEEELERDGVPSSYLEYLDLLTEVFEIRRCGRRPSVRVTRAPPHAVRWFALTRPGQTGPMTSLNDRPNTALLIVDVQRDVVANAHERDAVIANINQLLQQARGSDTPVIWVQHADDGLPEGSDGWQYVDELQRAEAEPLVHKHFGDSFEGTDLEDLLADRQVGRLVVTGAQTDACIRSTLHGALVRGYDVRWWPTRTPPRTRAMGPAGERRAGHRLHQHVLERVGRAGRSGTDRADRRRRLQAAG